MSHTSGAAGDAPVMRVAARPGDGRAVATVARETGDVRVVETGPTGIEGIEPLALATAGGRTAFLPDPDESTVRGAVEELAAGEVPGGTWTVDHDPGRRTLPRPSAGPLSVGRRRVLGPCGWVEPTTSADHAFVSPDRDAGDCPVGLLGRGRGDAVADEPASDAWEPVRHSEGDPVVVVNAHETDDRPRADRTLLAGAPLTVLDGAAAAAAHVGATDLVVYLAERDDLLAERVRDAADAATAELPVEVQVVAGPDEYRAGAPTCALEAMEGADRIEPRLQPPTPAEHGLYGRPTVVHTPRTVAQVRAALAGPEEFDPDATDPGTRLVTVTGDVAAPATVELEPDGDLDAASEAVDLDGNYKMACVGGPLGGFTRSLEVEVGARPLAAAGLGTDGVVELLTDRRCVVAAAGRRASFASEENSGRCVPGREGTEQLTALLRDVYGGDYEPETIRELGRVMQASANCRIGAHAPRPAMTAMDVFGAEVRAHAEGRCPAGVCEVAR
ncbi:MAG: NADH-ubiquinone oxidoreductase-F iron-sulfur binding region domain-containing protein [Haloarculaceae archaeon]